MVAHSTAIIFLTCFYSHFNVFSCFLVASHATQLDFPTPLPVFRLHVAVPPWPLPVQCFVVGGLSSEVQEFLSSKGDSAKKMWASIWTT